MVSSTARVASTASCGGDVVGNRALATFGCPAATQSRRGRAPASSRRSVRRRGRQTPPHPLSRFRRSRPSQHNRRRQLRSVRQCGLHNGPRRAPASNRCSGMAPDSRTHDARGRVSTKRR
jgi:hypothetical protein